MVVKVGYTLHFRIQHYFERVYIYRTSRRESPGCFGSGSGCISNRLRSSSSAVGKEDVYPMLLKVLGY